MGNNQIHTTKTAEETFTLGESLARKLKIQPITAKPIVVCLYGELGSGKTTFTQGFARGLDLQDRLVSPTFLLMRRYQLDGLYQWFYHLDLYRLSKISDIQALGIEEIFTMSDAIICIEWAERLEKLLPKQRIDIHCSLRDEDHSFVIDEI